MRGPGKGSRSCVAYATCVCALLSQVGAPSSLHFGNLIDWHGVRETPDCQRRLSHLLEEPCQPLAAGITMRLRQPSREVCRVYTAREQVAVASAVLDRSGVRQQFYDIHSTFGSVSSLT
jgi:hypothetical protein